MRLQAEALVDAEDKKIIKITVINSEDEICKREGICPSSLR